MKHWLIALVLLFTSASFAAIDVYDFKTPEQEQQFHELNATLRCPKCQNNTIADSNAELAKDLRQKVYEMTVEGKSKSEIVDYMIARYGNFVTYKPPFTAATSILWFGPLVVLLIGFGFIVRRSRKAKQAVQTVEKWDQDKEAKLQALLNDDQQGDKK
ncbi:cytochrome c-type biogenesis protein [Vibrio sp.]|uniref:cytochrome c-type biogenesis protein n=1 Tax=Vibrio sp. TaxID=678 RepID=UPI003D0D4F15